MQVSFVSKLTKSGTMPIHFVRCRDMSGKECYFFLIASQPKVSGMKSITEGTFDIREYGDIVASGFGNTPSAQVKSLLMEKYGFDADSVVH